jgi:DNA-binding GntR family transcriptional regulator
MTPKPALKVAAKSQKEAVSEPVQDADARLYQAIFDGVLNHRLTPGTKLPEPELCQLFGVGRNATMPS